MSHPYSHFLEINASTSFTMLLFAVWFSSLLGSGHCLGMCGPMAINVTSTWYKNIAYNVGRLFGYGILGGIAGFAGDSLLSLESVTIRYFLLAVMVGVVLWSGWSIATGRPPRLHLPEAFDHIFRFLFKNVMRASWLGSCPKAFSVGLMTAGLPCGWLYTYVAMAATSGGGLRGILVMVCFWLGTMPLMFAAPALTKRFLMPLQNRYPIVAGTLISLAGLLAIYFNWWPAVTSALNVSSSCH